MPDQTHPTTEELSAFSLGELSGLRADVIDRHVSECGPCCETIAGFASEDTFVSMLREAQQLLREPEDTLDQAISPSTNPATDERLLENHPRYEVVQRIGQGGMGCVYKARHRVMDRTVALKVIHGQWMRRQEAVDRFRREVKTAASMDHPNIVTAFDAEQADDVHFLVMEHVDGIDLAKKVKNEGPLAVDEACDLIRQTALGLQYAHECGMVHRDIKPHNLMITADSTVKILDFGLASLAPQVAAEVATERGEGELTTAGVIMGTPDYISPEQAIDARGVDGRSDIYSLGMTFYFLLAGRAPFEKGSATEKLRQHAEIEPTSLTEIRSDVPQPLLEVIRKMMAKDPAKRYQSPREVAEALARDLTSSTLVAPAAESRGTLLRVAIGFGAAVLPFFVGWFAFAMFAGQSVGDKLAKMKAPAEFIGTLDDEVPVILYTVAPESIGGERSALVCDIGESRLVLFGQDLSEMKNLVETNQVHLAGQDGVTHSVSWKDRALFSSRYENGSAECELLGFRFTMTDQFVTFADNGFRWKDPDSNGLLMIVDTETGKARTRVMKPRDQRVTLPGMSSSTIISQVPATGPETERTLYHLTAIPPNFHDIFGYRPRGIHQDGRFGAFLRGMGSGDLGAFLSDELERVLAVRFATESALSTPDLSDDFFTTKFLTVANHGAVEFANAKLGAKIPLSEGVDPGKFFRCEKLRPRSVHQTRNPANRAQLAFLQPEGITIRYHDGGIVPSNVPTRKNFSQGELLRFTLGNDSGRESVQWHSTIELPHATPRTAAFIAHNAIPIRFSEEDLEQVASGQFVTKVVYLPDPVSSAEALVRVETISSARLGPGMDPIVEADRRGSILAIIRIGNKPLQHVAQHEQLYVRVMDADTLIVSTLAGHEAYRAARKAHAPSEHAVVPLSSPDAIAFVAGNTKDKRFVGMLKEQFGDSAIASTLMTQLPLWEDSSQIALSISLGEEPQLQMAVEALTPEEQDAVTNTVRAVPVNLANLLRSFADAGVWELDRELKEQLIAGLSEARLDEPSETESRVTVSLRGAEASLVRGINSMFGLFDARDRAYRAASEVNLRTITQAFLLFQQRHGYLPSVSTTLPDARYPVSWRVAILPFVGEDALYDEYRLNEPWNSAHNRQLLGKMPTVYNRRPNDPRSGRTNYTLFAGEGTATGDGRSRVRMPEDFADNPAFTILIAETIAQTEWTKPEDLEFDEQKSLPIEPAASGGWLASFADGSTHYITTIGYGRVEEQVVKALITRGGGEQIVRGKEREFILSKTRSVSPNEAATSENVNSILQNNPDIREEVAEWLLEIGQTESAIEVMADVKELDPKAVAWKKVAEKYAASEDSENAIEAWLKAYELDVRLLSRDQLPLFRRTDRIPELVATLTEDRLKSLPLENDLLLVLKAALDSPNAKDEGYELMKRLWGMSESQQIEMLYGLPQKVWQEVPDKAFFLRTKFIPEDVGSVGAGWEYMTIFSFEDLSGGAISVMGKLVGLLEDEATRQSLLDEVQRLTDVHPEWHAGGALLAVLKAYDGKADEAAELLGPFVADLNDGSIPSKTAWLLADVLQDKGFELRRVVQKLYERSLAQRDKALPLRNSPIVPLAQFYYFNKGMKTRARNLLYRLAEQRYEPDSGVVCLEARESRNATRCNECHRGDRNLIDVMLMADKLTDIGYPVDAWLSLARIDASFRHMMSQDDEWTMAQAPDDLVDGIKDFRGLFDVTREKADAKITANAMIDALDEGGLAKQLSGREPRILDPHAPDIPRIELMLSVRGEGGKPRLFSPVVDLLKNVSERATAKDLDRLDWRLAAIPPGHRKSLDEVIAATVFSFQRNRLPEAKLRCEQLLGFMAAREPSGRDVGLWLVAREALAHGPTQIAGERFAERAREAAALVDSIPVEALR